METDRKKAISLLQDKYTGLRKDTNELTKYEKEWQEKRPSSENRIHNANAIQSNKQRQAEITDRIVRLKIREKKENANSTNQDVIALPYSK